MKTKIPTTTIVNLWLFRFGSNLSTLSPHNESVDAEAEAI